MKTTTSVVFALAVMAAALPENCSAKPSFVSRVPNGDNVPGVGAVGHSDDTGASGALNSFGDDFASAGNAWTVSLCQKDSDGDGQTNGQELGDPCCVWTSGATPQWTSGVSHPSDSSKTSDASQWANLNCSTVVVPTAAPTASSSASSPAFATAALVSSAMFGALVFA